MTYQWMLHKYQKPCLSMKQKTEIEREKVVFVSLSFFFVELNRGVKALFFQTKSHIRLSIYLYIYSTCSNNNTIDMYTYIHIGWILNKKKLRHSGFFFFLSFFLSLRCFRVDIGDENRGQKFIFFELTCLVYDH